MKILLYYGLKTKNNLFYKISFYNFLQLIKLFKKTDLFIIIANDIDSKYILKLYIDYKIKIIDLYTLVLKILNWNVLFKKLDILQNIDINITYFLPSYSNFNKPGFIHKIFKRVLLNNKYGLNSFIMQSPYKSIMIPYYVANILNVKTIQLILDPLLPIITHIENVYYFNKNNYFGYNNWISIYKYIWFSNLPTPNTQHPTKLYTFSFGMTANNFKSNRIDLIDDLLKLQQHNFNIYINCKKLKIKTYINYNSYNDIISKSKYTLIIPSLFEQLVSLRRILLAIYYNCIPLLYKTNNFNIILHTIPLIYNIIKLYIIQNIADIPYIIKKINYEDIIYLLKSVTDFTCKNVLTDFNLIII